MAEQYILKTYTHNAENLRRGVLQRALVGWAGPEEFPPVYLNWHNEWGTSRKQAQRFTYEEAHTRAFILNYNRARDEKIVPGGLCIVEALE